MINLIIYVVFRWHVWEAILDAYHMIGKQPLKGVTLLRESLFKFHEVLAKNWLFFVAVIDVVDPVHSCHGTQVLKAKLVLSQQQVDVRLFLRSLQIISERNRITQDVSCVDHRRDSVSIELEIIHSVV